MVNGDRLIRNKGTLLTESHLSLAAGRALDLVGTTGYFDADISVELESTAITLTLNVGEGNTASIVDDNNVTVDYSNPQVNLGYRRFRLLRTEAIPSTECSRPYVQTFTLEILSGSVTLEAIEHGGGTCVFTHELVGETYGVGTHTITFEKPFRDYGAGAYFHLIWSKNDVFTANVFGKSEEILQVTDYFYVYREDGWECIPPVQDRGAAGTVELVDGGSFDGGGIGGLIPTNGSILTNIEGSLHAIASSYSNITFTVPNITAGRTHSVVFDNISNDNGYISIFGTQASIEIENALEFIVVPSNSYFFVSGASMHRTVDNLSIKQVLPLSTKYRFEGEELGMFFTNPTALSQSTIDVMNAYPELVAKYLGGTTVEGLDARRVYGLMEPSGKYLVDSKIPLIEALNDGTSPTAVDFTPYGTSTVEDSGEYVKIVVGDHPNGAYVYLDRISSMIPTDHKTYAVIISAYATNPLIKMRLFYLPDHYNFHVPLSTTHKLFSVVGATNGVIGNRAFLSFNTAVTGDEIYVKIEHIYEVSAIEIQNYLETMRTNANNQTKGLQGPLVDTDAHGLITGASTRQVQTHDLTGVVAEGAVILDGSSSYSLRYFPDAVQNLLGEVNDNHVNTDSIAINNTLTEHGPGYIEVVNTAPTEESYHTRMRYYTTMDTDLRYEIFTHLTVLSGSVKVRQGYQESVANGKVFGFDPLGLEGEILPEGDYFATGEYTGFMFETMFDATEEHTFHILLKMESQEITGRTRQKRVLTQVYDISSNKSYLSIDGGPKRIAENIHPFTLSLDGDTVPIGVPTDPIAYGPMAYAKMLWSDKRILSDANYTLAKG